MAHLSTEFTGFFKELNENNNTGWFNENRKRYEKDVKKPFAAFVDEMIQRIQKYEPDVKIKPADAIMRINKDIRFSKDKTPYNTHVAANISPYGKKNKAYPGFYFQLSHEGVEIYGGAYMPEKEQLHTIRELIAGNNAEFEKIINNKDFVKHYGSLQGEKNKKLPPEFKDAAEKQPFIANKQFYYSASLPAIEVTKPGLADVLTHYYLAGKPVNDFLRKGF